MCRFCVIEISLAGNLYHHNYTPGVPIQQSLKAWITFTADPVLTDTHLCSMRLINVKAFLDRKTFLIREAKQVDRCTKVLESSGNKATDYAILSYQWLTQEVVHDEMVKPAKLDWQEREEICQCRRVIRRN